MMRFNLSERIPTLDDNGVCVEKELNLSEKMIKEFCEKKEAFIMEELQPYFKDGKMIQKVNLRLAEIEDFKRLANQRFEEFIKSLKEELFDEAIKRHLPLTDPSLDHLPCVWVNKHIDKFAGEELI